jgi:hypothetical protein
VPAATTATAARLVRYARARHRGMFLLEYGDGPLYLSIDRGQGRG